MAGQVITPKQLMMQWAVLPNKFEVNIFQYCVKLTFNRL